MYNVSFVNVNIKLITITIHYPYIYAVLKFIPT